jgi:RNA polymerase sigma factor (sigma-70 family)
MPTAPTHSEEVEGLYCDHHGWLRGWLRKKLGCAEQAADVAQDTFLRILTARDTLSGLREPRAYITTTAKHLLIDRARRARIEAVYLQELAVIAEQMDGAPAPEMILMALEALDQFSQALQTLPAKASEAFLLHYMEHQSQAEIAAHLDVSVRMVQKYLAQALLRCQLVWSQA